MRVHLTIWTTTAIVLLAAVAHPAEQSRDGTPLQPIAYTVRFEPASHVVQIDATFPTDRSPGSLRAGRARRSDRRDLSHRSPACDRRDDGDLVARLLPDRELRHSRALDLGAHGPRHARRDRADATEPLACRNGRRRRG